MDEIWLRVVLVAVMFAIAVGIAMARRGQRLAVRSIASPDLSAGLYLFSSEGCATCDSARAVIVESRGDDFIELVWERQPELFEKLAIDAVPSVLIVDGSGAGRLFPGKPERALRSL